MEIKSHEQAVSIANEIERLEAALKQMKESLKAFCRDNSAVETDDQVWDFHSSTTWKFEPNVKREMARHLAIEGVNPWDYIDFSASALKKIEKDVGWDCDVLKKFGKATVRFSFRSKKK